MIILSTYDREQVDRLLAGTLLIIIAYYAEQHFSQLGLSGTTLFPCGYLLDLKSHVNEREWTSRDSVCPARGRRVDCPVTTYSST